MRGRLRAFCKRETGCDVRSPGAEKVSEAPVSFVGARESERCQPPWSNIAANKILHITLQCANARRHK